MPIWKHISKRGFPYCQWQPVLWPFGQFFSWENFKLHESIPAKSNPIWCFLWYLSTQLSIAIIALGIAYCLMHIADSILHIAHAHCTALQRKIASSEALSIKCFYRIECSCQGWCNFPWPSIFWRLTLAWASSIFQRGSMIKKEALWTENSAAAVALKAYKPKCLTKNQPSKPILDTVVFSFDSIW